MVCHSGVFFFQAADGIRDDLVTGVQTCALPISYKAVNDNISLLQNIFEQSCGIVSTYLTEWDLSIYIQEGLLEDKNDKYPTYMSLLYRITKDNPSSYHDSKALVYGALNSAVSKTPYLGYKSNDSYFTPYNYPLSTYWWPYDDID